MVRQEAARFVDNAVVGAENRLLRILNGRIFFIGRQYFYKKVFTTRKII